MVPTCLSAHWDGIAWLVVYQILKKENDDVRKTYRGPHGPGRCRLGSFGQSFLPREASEELVAGPRVNEIREQMRQDGLQHFFSIGGIVLF